MLHILGLRNNWKLWHQNHHKNLQSNSNQATSPHSLRSTQMHDVNRIWFLDQCEHCCSSLCLCNKNIYSNNSQYSPGQMTFRMDMLFHQQVIINLEKIRHKRPSQAMNNDCKENKKGINHSSFLQSWWSCHQFPPTSKWYKQSKRASPTGGPYCITKVTANKTVYNFCKTLWRSC